MLRKTKQDPVGEKARRQSLPDMVVHELGQRIVRGDFAGKGTLPTEPELSAELGISRNVLREAVKVLASKGLLDVRPKTGMRIRDEHDWNLLDPDIVGWFAIDGSQLRNARDFVEFRRIIEPKASYLAAIRASGADIDAIRSALETLEACIGRPHDVPDADIVFHRSIYDASHNVILRHLGSLIAPLMQTQVVMTTELPGSFEKGLPLHRKVTKAIANRNPKQAETYSRLLVNMPYQDLQERLHPEDRGLLG
jgi:GntR family transcriptional regulator, galactonate operon transcriptional repressor